MASALVTTDLPDLTLISRGKVRDIYRTSAEDCLLFVATDRISVFDVILTKGIPDKGKALTRISLFWFEKLKHIVPNHLVTADIDQMPEEMRKYGNQLEGRSMLVKRAKVIPIEFIVRGYLTGSAWAEYKKHGTMFGIPLPENMLESQRLPEPLVTPSTKAEQGEHDENISPKEAERIIGAELYSRVAAIALKLYATAAEYAISRGLVLADTKFEFGLISPSNPSEEEVILVDEVLTPDSSRYWPLDKYEPGKSQPNFDKQYVRDWLVSQGYRRGLEKGPEGTDKGWDIDADVIEGTQRRYLDVENMLKREEPVA
ncbi:hypothetical protein SCLCIDRAFT_1207494 [Scleroderma citrinum Foug A]|uniref:Phosphoribosylaminoimidazole-succinocarboxamide synthase n=1 Tax=Scleroderma citrinum Foug A TaxID=1036808 RepID=A0A0C3EPW9_9AGAM|nr:hypothetical protein SCLCIDRAFT_1207494 [Scleroderma citrinum Foug A]